MHPARIALLVAVFATIHPLALAQSKPTAAADVAGRWNGSIEIPGAPLEIEINL